MGLFARVRRMLTAAMHETLDRAEQPARMLNQQILEMRENLEHARMEVASAMAAERRLIMQAGDAAQAVEQWDHRARRAIEFGDEELAREALRRKLTAQELNRFYQHAHEQQVKSVASLRDSLTHMESRLLEFKAKRTQLLAQLENAKAQRVIARSLHQAVGADAFEAFDRVAFQADAEYQQALAFTELVEGPDDALVLAERNEAIETELSAMKYALGYVERKAMHQALEGGDET